MASRGWAEPSLSLPAAFLFLANCFQMLHSTLATLCAARHLCASHNRCMIILLVLPNCMFHLLLSFFVASRLQFLQSFSGSLSAYFTVSLLFLACSCLCQLLHHRTIHFAEIVFDEFHQNCSLWLSDGHFLASLGGRKMYPRYD